MKHTVATLAHSMKGNDNLSETLRKNLTALSEALHTTDADNQAQITIETFHNSNSPISQDNQALELLQFASQRMGTVVEPVLTDDMNSSQRILELVRAQEATTNLTAIRDNMAYIGTNAYDGKNPNDGIL